MLTDRSKDDRASNPDSNRNFRSAVQLTQSYLGGGTDHSHLYIAENMQCLPLTPHARNVLMTLCTCTMQNICSSVVLRDHASLHATDCSPRINQTD